MSSIIRLVAVVAGFVLMLHVTPSWGQLVNPTVSDGNFNTAGGTFALSDLVSGPSGGFSNTGFGFEALTSNTTGDSNTACGAFTLISNTTGNFNTATGAAALESNTTGNQNTATGSSALISNTTGNFNTATGDSSLASNTTGNNNTASGHQALFVNDTGNNNIAMGHEAQLSNTTGSGNAAMGVLALSNNTAGSNNTAVGFKALKKSLGTKNIAIGYQAGVTLTTGNNNIYIGNSGNGDESQTIRIGTAQAQTFIAGIAGAAIVSNAATVAIDTTTGQLGLAPVSSARYKQDIAPMASQSAGVLQLHPVTFAYKEDVHHVKHYGLVAEEVATVYPELVTHTATGEAQTVQYQELIPMLLNELQRQQQELAEVAALRKELAELRALVGARSVRYEP